MFLFLLWNDTSLGHVFQLYWSLSCVTVVLEGYTPELYLFCSADTIRTVFIYWSKISAFCGMFGFTFL